MSKYVSREAKPSYLAFARHEDMIYTLILHFRFHFCVLGQRRNGALLNLHV